MKSLRPQLTAKQDIGDTSWFIKYVVTVSKLVLKKLIHHLKVNLFYKFLDFVNNRYNFSNYNNVNIFSGLYQNVRGLWTKLNLLRVNIPCLNYDFFALTETWLCYSIRDNELSFNNYKVFRSDHNYYTSKCKRGGGVA